MVNRYSEQERSEHIKEIPVGRYGTVEDIGRVVTFLASPMADYVTGIVLPVDGGLRRYYL
jgi:3-oxoacyl-[acyl-carrier protein] reductase